MYMNVCVYTHTHIHKHTHTHTHTHAHTCTHTHTGFPGVLWPRDTKSPYGLHTCGKSYDPRYRPWFLTASNGPKNVVFILGHVGQYAGIGIFVFLNGKP